MSRPRKAIRAKRRSDNGLYTVAYIEAPGRWHETPYEDEAEALRWAKRNRDQILAALGSGGPRLRVYAEGFFDRGGDRVTRREAKGREVGDGYLSSRQSIIRRHIIPLWGDLAPGEITEYLVDGDLLERMTSRGTPLAGATKNKIKYTLRLILEDLVRRRILAANPLPGELEAFDESPVAPRSALPRERLAEMYPPDHGGLVRVWGSSMWAALMLVLNDSGARPGELRALRWSDWWAEERFFPIRHAVKAGTKDKVGGLKTEREGVSARPAFVSRRTAQELELWRAESRWSGPNDFVFTADGRAPVTNNGIVKAFRRGLRGLGIDAPGWTPYYLRHTFGTYALEVLDDPALRILMGHTNITTANVYRHPDDLTLLRSALEIRDKLDAMREPHVVPFKVAE